VKGWPGQQVPSHEVECERACRSGAVKRGREQVASHREALVRVGVTWRRAQLVLLSAQCMDVAAIAKVAFTSVDRVISTSLPGPAYGRSAPQWSGGLANNPRSASPATRFHPKGPSFRLHPGAPVGYPNPRHLQG